MQASCNDAFEVFFNSPEMRELIDALFGEEEYKIAFKSICRNIYLKAEVDKRMAVINYINFLIDDNTK